MSDDDDKYFSLSNDLDDLRFGYGTKDKAVAGAKLLGKGIFNVTRFVFSSAVPAAEQMKSDMERKKSK